MGKLDRRLLVDSTLFGVVLTLLVAGADALGLLSPLERWLYDERALRCQHWTPPPTDKLVHVDIDDAALDAIGHWPWDRSTVAEILDELRLAGAKAVALDVLFSEPQKPELRKPNVAVVEVDHDARLAKAVADLGNCVVSANFPFRREDASPVYVAAKQVLMADPETPESRLRAALWAKGVTPDDLEEQVQSQQYGALRDALYERIRATGAGLDANTLMKQLLPHTVRPADTSELRVDTLKTGAFEDALLRAEAAAALRRHALPLPASGPAPVQGTLTEPPLPVLSNAAAAAGFVDYTQSSDGRVRSVPLLLEHDGVVYPQLGVALAWRLLGADPSRLKVEAGRITIPRGALGDLVVPVHTDRARELFAVDRDVPLSANLAWFGGRDWAAMYGTHGAARVPIASVFEACRVRREIEANHELASDRMSMVLSDELYKEFALKKLPPDDVAGHLARIERVLANPTLPAENEPDRAEAEKALVVLKAVRDANPTLQKDLDAHRARLHDIFKDKAVLVGWTATGVIADFFPTSLHPRCPGVVLHGVVFNQVMTGEVWRTLPPWVTLAATLAVGLLATAAVSLLSPARALAACAILAVAYLGLNGYLLFDYGNLVVGAAGPLVAVGAVFTGGTLAKLLVERWERARITRRFSSYVDPKLVEYVLEHPDQAHFEGQVREMSVVFCDVAGFTRLTETRGSETVQILNELWGVVVPAIKRHGGLINKFMGDGIMFFYGAPEQSPRHARDAVATVLAVRKAVERFNAEVAAGRGWPALMLRCGVSTGNMVVGDAGYTTSGEDTRADYTVLGDNVNLGSRLEAANKAVGTGALVTERTYDLSRDAGILYRPVGKLCVVGKTAGVMTYEPMALLDDATEQQKSVAAMTRAVVEPFMAGRLTECVEAIGQFEAAHGRSKLTDLYRDRCEWFLRDPSPEPFDCQIVLTEK
jgi:CHASE2 domain-containing sensor protein/class 3 adenylate cyclase